MADSTLREKGREMRRKLLGDATVERIECVISDATNGRDAELKLHLRMARNQGWTEDELVESLLHLGGYVGAPLIREALLTAKETFAEMRAEK